MYKSIMEQILTEMEANALRFEDDKTELEPQAYVSEFRTIHLGYGRRIGKTRYIVDTAVEGDVILLGRAILKQLYTTKADILISSGIKKDVDKRYNTIFVDEPNLHHDLKVALSRLVKDYDQTVIMVGA